MDDMVINLKMMLIDREVEFSIQRLLFDIHDDTRLREISEVEDNLEELQNNLIDKIINIPTTGYKY